ncbi:MAG: hypothetical protein EAZ57_06845 [Cytophagales bacterium]|nr:MAG: hypothetical protein EAZ67_07690 [Cytophagales bacterium]TAF60575.1 MAG: hypothetical protein EAZ57_06845 [Cytophagales bacterium]
MKKQLRILSYVMVMFSLGFLASCGDKGTEEDKPKVDIALEGSPDAANANFVVKADVSSAVKTDAATITGSIISLPAGFNALEFGHVYAKGTADATLETGTAVKSTRALAKGDIVSNLKALEPDTDYTARLYIKTAKSTIYSPASAKFRTQKPSASTPPSVQISPVAKEDIMVTSFKANGRITGGVDITDHGFVYSATNKRPTIADTKVSLGAGTSGASFMSEIKGLMGGTSYFVTAYATNAAGTGYGTVVEVKTNVEFEYFPELALFFNKVSDDSTEIRYGGELFLGFVRVAGFNRAGGLVNVPDPKIQKNVIVLFGPDVKQKAHRFTVDKRGPGVPAKDYKYRDYVDVPFIAYDTVTKKQLMISFRDQQEDGRFTLLPIDTAEPFEDDSREYIYVHAQEYDETKPNTDIAKNGGMNAQLMLNFWVFKAD